VLTVLDPRLVVDDVPEKEASAMAADFYQPQTWYVAAGGILYRSDNDGDSWESIYRAPDATIVTIDCNPYRAGWLAMTTRPASGDGSQILISRDCGESWDLYASTQFEVMQVAWIPRDNGLALLLATTVGLYELSMLPNSAPVQVFVMSQDEQLGYYAVAVSISRRGNVAVAVAARQSGGIFLSTHAGKGNTFRAVGLAGEDVRVLATEQDGDRSFLWAGLAAPRAGDVGKGCRVLEILEEDGAATWEEINKSWIGGSCTNIAFYQSNIFAATYDAGVLVLSHRSSKEDWKAPAVQSGLPLVDRVRTFERIDCLAHSPNENLLMTGSSSGVFRSKDEGATYSCCSRKVFTDRVALPSTWVFCSGEHEIEVKPISER
jgi:photosystem II stability/assembly factor-like uncharacterized protein